MVLDVVDNTFNINLEQKANHTVIKIFAQDKEYSLMMSGKYHIFEVSVNVQPYFNYFVWVWLCIACPVKFSLPNAFIYLSF